jgi:hypothetical protein
MKKSLSLILAALLLSASFVACTTEGDRQETTANTNESVTTGTVETNAPETDAATTEEVTTEAPAPSEDELAAAASVETIANALIGKYAEFAGIRESYDAYMAELPAEDQISYEEFMSYQLSVAPVDTTAEELWLQGFTTAPTGFSEAYCYQPMMMGQAFIGYVFRVAEGTDVEAFKKTLTETCDPRWNICTMANTTVCESFGNLVYFSMMVVADEENPFGFTAEQKDAFYNTFIETITGSAN